MDYFRLNIESIAYGNEPNKSYLTLMPNFSKTKTPQKLSGEEIAEHNKAKGNSIVPLEQNPDGLSNADKVLNSKSKKVRSR